MSITIDNRTPYSRDLTGNERSTIWNALIVARDRYREDARQMLAEGTRQRDAGNPAGHVAFGRLAEQFDRQAREADGLVETFE